MRPDAHGPSMCTDCSGTGQAAAEPDALAAELLAYTEGLNLTVRDGALMPKSLVRQAAQRIEALQAVADAAERKFAKLREAAQGEYLARGSGDVEPLGPWIDNIIGDTASSGEGKE